MIEGMSARQEWYAETDYDPGPTSYRRWNGLPAITRLPPGMRNARFTLPSVGQLVTNQNGDPVGVIQSLDPNTGRASIIQTGMTTERRSDKSSDGTHMGGARFDISITDEISRKLDVLGSAIKDLYKVFGKANKQSDYVLFPPPIPDDESPRDRALRLAKQPHSMAASGRNNWTLRGNKRK